MNWNTLQHYHLENAIQAIAPNKKKTIKTTMSIMAGGKMMKAHVITKNMDYKILIDAYENPVNVSFSRTHTKGSLTWASGIESPNFKEARDIIRKGLFQ